jgi:hypothetical protein
MRNDQVIYFRKNALRKKRERKRLLRKWKLKKHLSEYSTYNKVHAFQKSVDKAILKNFKFELYDFLFNANFINGQETQSTEINIPPDFSFCSNYEITINTIRDLITSCINNVGDQVTLNFQNCTKVDQLSLFVLQVFKLEFTEKLNRLDQKLTILTSKISFRIIPSKDDVVNKMLFAHGLAQEETEIKVSGLMPEKGIGYLKGSKSQKHYSENKKGAIATRIRYFLNECLKEHGYEFNPSGENEIDGLLSEILGNGEDHSPFDTYYSTANYFLEFEPQNENDAVGEINLSVLNFGYSIYEGLEETKLSNYENYEFIESLCQKVYPKANSNLTTRSNLFTLYALQEGVSRLKFEDSSRGNGTMKFINSFFALGDFEDNERNYHPELSIISGCTQVICDTKYRPFQVNGINFLSLNSENDLSIPPDPSNLKKLLTPFPGTVLNAKIYLNKIHLSKKINGD